MNRCSANTWTRAVSTARGDFIATFSTAGLCALEFPNSTGSTRAASRVPTAMHPPDALDAWLKDTVRAVRSVLAGRAPDRLPPLDLSGGTEFQRAVWLALVRIPLGQTRTYAQVAEQVGRPRACRAVGRACGANPVPLLIPCHRVVAAGGAPGGFSGGLEWKRLLLDVEGVDFPPTQGRACK